MAKDHNSRHLPGHLWSTLQEVSRAGAEEGQSDAGRTETRAENAESSEWCGFANYLPPRIILDADLVKAHT